MLSGAGPGDGLPASPRDDVGARGSAEDRSGGPIARNATRGPANHQKGAQRTDSALIAPHVRSDQFLRTRMVRPVGDGAVRTQTAIRKLQQMNAPRGLFAVVLQGQEIWAHLRSGKARGD